MAEGIARQPRAEIDESIYRRLNCPSARPVFLRFIQSLPRAGANRMALALTHIPDPEDAESLSNTELLKLMKERKDWHILPVGSQGLHRTLEGQLFVVDRIPANRKGIVTYTAARGVTYSQACDWVRSHSFWANPEVLLQFHGISNLEAPERRAA